MQREPDLPCLNVLWDMCFDNLFNEYKTNRIIIATFASNVDRVQQIINTAYRFGRKVAVEGRSMVNVITTAAELDTFAFRIRL